MNAGLSHGEKARERSLRVIVKRKAPDFSKRFGDGDGAMGDRAPIKAREEESLLARKARAHEGLMPWQLLSAVKAKREGEAKLARLSHGKTSSPQERLYKGLPIRKEEEHPSSSTGGACCADPPMTGEGKAQVPACFAREGASIKEERALEEAFARSELAKPGELAPHVAGMGVRSERAREAFRGEHMKERGEGEAFAFRELRISAPRSQDAGD